MSIHKYDKNDFAITRNPRVYYGYDERDDFEDCRNYNFNKDKGTAVSNRKDKESKFIKAYEASVL